MVFPKKMGPIVNCFWLCLRWYRPSWHFLGTLFQVPGTCGSFKTSLGRWGFGFEQLIVWVLRLWVSFCWVRLFFSLFTQRFFWAVLQELFAFLGNFSSLFWSYRFILWGGCYMQRYRHMQKRLYQELLQGFLFLFVAWLIQPLCFIFSTCWVWTFQLRTLKWRPCADLGLKNIFFSIVTTSVCKCRLNAGDFTAGFHSGLTHWICWWMCLLWILYTFCLTEQ